MYEFGASHLSQTYARRYKLYLRHPMVSPGALHLLQSEPIKKYGIYPLKITKFQQMQPHYAVQPLYTCYS